MTSKEIATSQRAAADWTKELAFQFAVFNEQGLRFADDGLLNAQPGKRDADSERGEGMSDRERVIRHGFCFDSDRDAEAAKYLLGVIDTIRCDRDRLRSERTGHAESSTAPATGSQYQALKDLNEFGELVWVCSNCARNNPPGRVKCLTCGTNRKL